MNDKWNTYIDNGELDREATESALENTSCIRDAIDEAMDDMLNQAVELVIKKHTSAFGELDKETAIKLREAAARSVNKVAGDWLYDEANGAH